VRKKQIPVLAPRPMEVLEGIGKGMASQSQKCQAVLKYIKGYQDDKSIFLVVPHYWLDFSTGYQYLGFDSCRRSYRLLSGTGER